MIICMRFVFRQSFVWAILILIAANTRAENIDIFIKKHAVESELAQVKASISFYLDDRFRKNEIFWHPCIFLTQDGEELEHPEAKFNTLNNALYLKQKGKVYRVNAKHIRSFTIFDRDESRKFTKGFKERHISTLTFSFSSPSVPILEILAAYEHFDQFQLLDLQLKTEADKKGVVSLQLFAAGNTELRFLENYLEKQEQIHNVSVQSENVKLETDTFLELKVERPQVSIVKLNYMRISESEAVSLSQERTTNMFSENSLYICNDKQEVQRILFTRKSIIEALSFVGITPPKGIPFFRTEKKLVNWFEGIL